jgi:hypothetical protein
MYGTRDAAQNWEYVYSAFMTSVVFARGQGYPYVFFHSEKGTKELSYSEMTSQYEQ